MGVVKCPRCGQETEFEGNKYRPFCSERCKLIDFGAWVDEQYNLPAESSTLTEEELSRIEKVSEEKVRK
jgi:endogenous inhibitor of DNA gyrase (YacG/DUF329 family)